MTPDSTNLQSFHFAIPCAAAVFSAYARHFDLQVLEHAYVTSRPKPYHVTWNFCCIVYKVELNQGYASTSIRMYQACTNDDALNGTGKANSGIKNYSEFHIDGLKTKNVLMESELK